MNTNAVSQLLGVSSSTVQRWVKHLGLEMERNEFGHYIYSEGDIDSLKQFQKELQKGVPIQSISIEKKQRQGTAVVKKHIQFKDEKWIEKIRELESRLNNKADSVVAYQLMQHRSEIEELQKKVAMLEEQLDELQEKRFTVEDIPLEDESKDETKKKKKNFFGAIFSS